MNLAVVCLHSCRCLNETLSLLSGLFCRMKRRISSAAWHSLQWDELCLSSLLCIRGVLGQGSFITWKSTVTSSFNVAWCANLARLEGSISHVCKPRPVLRTLCNVLCGRGCCYGVPVSGLNLQCLKLPCKGFPSVMHLSGELDLKPV